jgi:hypothetical protein
MQCWVCCTGDLVGGAIWARLQPWRWWWLGMTAGGISRKRWQQCREVAEDGNLMVPGKELELNRGTKSGCNAFLI